MKRYHGRKFHNQKVAEKPQSDLGSIRIVFRTLDVLEPMVKLRVGETLNLLRLRAAIKKYLQEDEFQRALVLYEKLVAQQNVKLTFEDWLNKGMCHFKLGQHQQAIQDYGEAIRLKPDYAETYFNRGLTC